MDCTHWQESGDTILKCLTLQSKQIEISTSVHYLFDAPEAHHPQTDLNIWTIKAAGQLRELVPVLGPFQWQLCTETYSGWVLSHHVQLHLCKTVDRFLAISAWVEKCTRHKLAHCDSLLAIQVLTDFLGRPCTPERPCWVLLMWFYPGTTASDASGSVFRVCFFECTVTTRMARCYSLLTMPWLSVVGAGLGLCLNK